MVSFSLKGNFVHGQYNLKYRDIAPLNYIPMTYPEISTTVYRYLPLPKVVIFRPSFLVCCLASECQTCKYNVEKTLDMFLSLFQFIRMK